MSRITTVAMLLAVLSSCDKKSGISLDSPNGNIEIVLGGNSGRISMLAKYMSDTIIHESHIGMVVNDIDLSRDAYLLDYKLTSFDETWKTVNGKNKEVRNHYNELRLECRGPATFPIEYQIRIRCYDEGFAWRYIFPEQEGFDSLDIAGENSLIDISADYTFWTYNGENHNIGPVRVSESEPGKYRIPLVLRSDQDMYMAVHEAEIIRYAPFDLQVGESEYSIGFMVQETKDKLPLKTSWRCFLTGDQAKDLVNSNLLVNLNEPCAIKDPSWIKPGKTVWDWRVWGYEAPDGFIYDLNTESHKRFIDFASENNIQYLLIDADWYGPEFSPDADPSSGNEKIDIEYLMAYARDRKVGIILYLNDVGAKAFGLERVLKQFADWGASGVKYGFMTGSMEERVRHTRKVVELCARYKLTVNFHDSPIPPSGDRRIYPNLITKEFCHSQADALRSYWPETIVTSTFVNMVAGPLDMCNGWFGFDNAMSRVRVFEEIPGTVAAEVAKLIIVYSGMNLLSDSPEEYLKKDDVFDAIRKMPAEFDSFEVIDGEIGEYIVVTRRSGEDWFIGSLTNREARTLEIDLGFLPEGQKFLATLYEDKATTHFMEERESYEIRSSELDRNSRITIRMSPGGGHAMYLKKL